MYKELKRSIPLAAALGGAILGLLSVLSELMGCLSGGTSILLSVTIIFQIFESAAKEGMGNLGGLGDID